MKWGLIVFFLVSFMACKNIELRPDPYKSPLETNDHALLMQYCDQFGTTIACQVPQDSGIPEPLTIHAPVGGTAEIIGCGIRDKRVIENTGPNAFIISDLPDLQDEGTGCVLDVFYAWHVPQKWRARVPVKGLHGKIFLNRVSRLSTPASVTYNLGPSSSGALAIKVRDGAQNGHWNSLKITVTQESAGGFYRLSGCNQGITKREFSGASVNVPLSQLIPDPVTFADCLYFGFALDKKGLVDQFSVGVSIVSNEAEPLAVTAQIKGTKLCYEAEKFVSIVTYGGQVSNASKGCFELTAGTVISFYTVQGRAKHGLLEIGGGVTWVK